MTYIDNTSEYKASSQEYLLALVRYSSFIKLLDTTNKSYTKLLQWLFEYVKDPSNEDKRLPTIKEISSQIGIEASKTTKYLKTIYNDICELNENAPAKFLREGQKVCDLYFRYFRYRAWFTLGLNEIPKIGESFNFDFLYPKTGCRTFHVSQISHLIEDTQQTISITFTGGEENLYLRLLNEKAYLRGDISTMDYINLKFGYDMTLQDKLLKTHQHL